jgi:hypothetical protein
MPHLGTFREGWNNERIAEFILSRFCFVARPAGVADDIGADLYCSLFERRRLNGHMQLLPRAPFVIQIKSSVAIVSLTRHLAYLSRLESPFFVGVVRRSDLSLRIYSGRYLPFLLSYRGDQPTSLSARLARSARPTRPVIKASIEGTGVRPRLVMPLLVTIRATASDIDLQRASEVLASECLTVGLSTYLRLTGQFVLSFPSTQVRMVLAGPGSANVFRANFEDRLTEYVCNLIWLKDNSRKRYRITEARTLLVALRSMEAFLPRGAAFRQAVRRLEELVDG